MASSVTAPLERQFGADAGPEADDLHQLGRRARSSPCSSIWTLSLDVAEQEVQAAINAGRQPVCRPTCRRRRSTARSIPADAPILTLALTSTTLPLTQVEDLADTRLAQKISQLAGRRPGQHQRRAAAGGAHPGQPHGAGGLRPEPRRPAHGDRATPTSTRPRAASTAPRQSYDHRRQRSAPIAGRLPADLIVAYRNGAPVRLSDVADVVDGAENAKLAAWMNDKPGGHSQHPAPAGRQHHRGRRPHQGSCCRSCRAPLPAVGRGHGAHRPHHHHPRLGRRCAVRADAGRGPGGAGDLPVPAQPAGDDHPQRRRAAVAGRHLRR